MYDCSDSFRDFKGQASGFGSDSGSGSYIDQAYQTLTGAGLTTVDVEVRFGKTRNSSYYYKTDHHWTTSAAYLAFQKFAELAELDTVRSDI